MYLLVGKNEHGAKKSPSKSPDFLFFSLFGHVLYGGKGVGFFLFFVSKIASDMIEWMNG